MKAIQKNDYGWADSEMMHSYSLLWQSRLNFILKEQKFLRELLQIKVLPLMESQLSPRAEAFIESMDEIIPEAHTFLEKINDDRNGLEILFKEENSTDSCWNYKHKHRKLLIKIHEFNTKYETLKTSVFETVCQAIKIQKVKKLAI